jgi:hypothetical protein
MRQMCNVPGGPDGGTTRDVVAVEGGDWILERCRLHCAAAARRAGGGAAAGPPVAASVVAANRSAAVLLRECCIGRADARRALSLSLSLSLPPPPLYLFLCFSTTFSRYSFSQCCEWPGISPSPER